MHTLICKDPTNEKSNNGWKNWWKIYISWKKLGIMDVNMEKWVDTFIYCVKFLKSLSIATFLDVFIKEM